MQMIYGLTCSAIIHAPAHHGHIGLHRNVQWMDPATISHCDLTHLEGTMEYDVLDPQRSVIVVKDFAGDGNTFKAMDHLMADPVTFGHIQERGLLIGFGGQSTRLDSVHSTNCHQHTLPLLTFVVTNLCASPLPLHCTALHCTARTQYDCIQ